MAPLPLRLEQALRPINLICGHYGVGKTNFSCNLILDLAHEARQVTALDLDIVNPYFRATEQRKLLEEAGVHLISPVCAEAGTSLDIPSLPGSMGPAFDSATDESPVVVDVGGDDVGSTALGRFSSTIEKSRYCMIGVLNVFRNLVQDPHDAVQNFREIEEASRLELTALVSNAHLKSETTIETIERGYEYACEVSEMMDLPLVAVTVPKGMQVAGIGNDLVYPIETIVRTPWE